MTSKLLTLYELGVLQLVKQNRIEDLSQQIEFSMQGTDILEKFSNMGYIEFIKGKKGQSQFELIRTTKKANDVLEDVSIPTATDGDLKMRDYLIEMYLNNEDSERSIGNKKKIAEYITIMRNELNLTLHQFFYLCEYFLAEYPFTKVLEYIFFNSNKNRYGKFQNNLEDSSLYQFYDTKRLEVENYWNLKIKE
jgi:hypothetical protein